MQIDLFEDSAEEVQARKPAKEQLEEQLGTASPVPPAAVVSDEAQLVIPFAGDGVGSMESASQAQEKPLAGPGEGWASAVVESALQGTKGRLKLLQADAGGWSRLCRAVSWIACQKGAAMRSPCDAAGAQKALFGWACRLTAEDEESLRSIRAAMLEASDIPSWPPIEEQGV